MKFRLSCILVFGNHASNPSGAIRVPSTFSLSSQKASFLSQNQPTDLKKKKKKLISILITQPEGWGWDGICKAPWKLYFVVCTMKEWIFGWNKHCKPFVLISTTSSILECFGVINNTIPNSKEKYIEKK